MAAIKDPELEAAVQRTLVIRRQTGVDVTERW
jgi:hypothetical protein